MPRKSREPAKPEIQRPGFTLAPERQQQIIGLLLAGVGALSLLSLVSVSPGSLTDRWAFFLRSVFGWGAFVVAGILLWIGGDLFQRVLRRGVQVVSWEQVAALEATVVAGLGLLHMWALPQDPLALADSGGGGGYIGWALSRILSQWLSPVGAMMVFLFIILGSQAMIGQKSPLAALARWLERLAQQPEVGVSAEMASNSAATVALAAPAAGIAEKPVGPLADETPQRAGKKGNAPAKPKQARPKDPARSMKDLQSDGELPPLSLLEAAAPLVSKDADNRARAEIIESTLASFGVPARVVQINYGPTITQFGVEPQFLEKRSSDGETRKRKVRVSRITSLSNDLALALAAPSIRIEAPVPGRPYVGIEVPNSKPSLVSMRLIMESEAYQRHPSRLKMTLGQDVAGNPVVADLATMPHCLIAGATGSGKSVCVNSMIASLLFNNTPQELQMILVDPKRVELTGFNGVPHLIAPVVVETEKVVGALRWMVMQMDQRYREFEKAQARNITQYNEIRVRRDEAKMSNIVVVIDELADLMMVAPDETERLICRLAQMARATGIHLILATQRPSVDVVTGLIKANFPTRISFAVSSQVDSRVILDSPGAEKLLGRGDMLYLSADAPQPVRLQGVFVSNQELSHLVRFWKLKALQILAADSASREDDTLFKEGAALIKGERVAPRRKNVSAAAEDTPPWEGMFKGNSGAEGDQGLITQAIDQIKQQEYTSISFLQRKLRIGYPRAARLVDEMIDSGTVIQEANGRLRVAREDVAQSGMGKQAGALLDDDEWEAEINITEQNRRLHGKEDGPGK